MHFFAYAMQTMAELAVCPGDRRSLPSLLGSLPFSLNELISEC